MGKRKVSSDDEEWTEEKGDKKETGQKKKQEEEGPAKKTKEAPAAKLTKLWTFPASFLCSSGEAVWGHLQTVLEGGATGQHDGKSGPSRRAPGGTILQSDFAYRAAVRVGTWKVTRAYIDGDEVGFVVHHEDVSALDLLKRAAAVGISHGQKHPDKDIVYVNRYDWSWHHGNAEEVAVSLGSEEVDEYGDPAVGRYMGGRLFFLDARSLPAFISAVKYLRTSFVINRKKNTDLGRCVSFTDGAGEPFGVQVMMPDTEYELGWLAFSGKKHEKFTESDELVGLVYDGAYSSLRNAEDEEGTPSVDE